MADGQSRNLTSEETDLVKKYSAAISKIDEDVAMFANGNEQVLREYRRLVNLKYGDNAQAPDLLAGLVSPTTMMAYRNMVRSYWDKAERGMQEKIQTLAKRTEIERWVDLIGLSNFILIAAFLFLLWTVPAILLGRWNSKKGNSFWTAFLLSLLLSPLLGIILVSMAPAKGTTLKAGSEYRKIETGGMTTFEITPAAALKNGYVLFVGSIAFIIGALFSMASPFGLVFVLIGIAAFPLGLRDPRPARQRQPMTFRVTSNSIESYGQTFRKDDIHRIIIRNAMTDRELPVTVYTTNYSVAEGQAWRAANAMRAHTLNVESGGKSIVLAGGMDETTAYGLFHDVCKILGFKVN